MKPLILIIFSMALIFSGCSGIEGFFSGDIPSFAVKPLESSSIRSLGKFQNLRNAQQAAKIQSNLHTASLKIFSKSISCAKEVAYSNAAPQLIGTPNLTGQDYVTAFYAQANFYDCNARQQALEDVPQENERDEEGQEIENPIKVYTAEMIGPRPNDFTRFVSWTDDPNSENVQGKLVNLYLQDDGIRTKTRIDLEKTGGAKTINSLFLSSTETDLKTYTRADFTEMLDANIVVEHRVSGRHYNSHDDVIINVASSVKKNIGASVFVKKCASPSAFSDSCNLASPTAYYYDSDGAVITESQASSLGLITNSNTLTIINNFYTGTEEDYFQASFDVVN